MLDSAAKANNRTLTAEIVSRLEHSFKLPTQIGSLTYSLESLEANHQKSASVTTRLIELYEAQAALSKLQQGIIDELLKERQGDQPENKGSDQKPGPATGGTPQFIFDVAPPKK